MWKVVTLSLFLIGCTNAPRLTAGLIGCPADEIEVVDRQKGLFQGTWTAKCRGKTFYCSATAMDGGVNGTCKEALPPQPKYKITGYQPHEPHILSKVALTCSI